MLVLAVMVGCNSQAPPATDGNNAPAAPVAKPPATPAPSPPGEIPTSPGGYAFPDETSDGIAIGIDEAVMAPTFRNSKAGTGNVYVIVMARLANGGEAIAQESPNDFSLVNTKGDTAPVSSLTYSLTSYLNAGALYPGAQTVGKLMFEIPTDTNFALRRHAVGGDQSEARFTPTSLPSM